jgi:hypothetical protein
MVDTQSEPNLPTELQQAFDEAALVVRDYLSWGGREPRLLFHSEYLPLSKICELVLATNSNQRMPIGVEDNLRRLLLSRSDHHSSYSTGAAHLLELINDKKKERGELRISDR